MSGMTQEALSSLYEQRGKVIWLTLLRITHPDWASPLRFVGGTSANVTHGGVVYVPRAFTATLPSLQDGKTPDIKINIDMTGADSAEVQKWRGVATTPKATLTMVLASSPSVAQIGPYEYSVKSRELAAESISLSLTRDTILKQSFPRVKINPVTVPGLFSGTVHDRS